MQYSITQVQSEVACSWPRVDGYTIDGFFCDFYVAKAWSFRMPGVIAETYFEVSDHIFEVKYR